MLPPQDALDKLKAAVKERVGTIKQLNEEITELRQVHIYQYGAAHAQYTGMKSHSTGGVLCFLMPPHVPLSCAARVGHRWTPRRD